MEITNQEVLIDTNVGTIQALKTEGRHLKVGENLSAVISADRLNLSMHANQEANQCRCTVVSEEFVGAIVTLFLETENKTELKIQKQQREVEQIDIGDDSALWVSWLPEDVYILPAT